MSHNSDTLPHTTSRAYVGPEEQFDFMGATQFRLLTSLGLRDTHSLLDYGCGALRAGRLFMTYLQPGRYYGVDPNKWLVDEAVNKELSKEFISLRKPSFNYNSEFNFSVFNKKFDYIVLQSVFSHTGKSLMQSALANSQLAMHDKTVLVATFVHDEYSNIMQPGKETDGWLYPECCYYTRSEIISTSTELGLHSQILPWFHPRQTWWLFTKSADGLLSQGDLAQLGGTTIKNMPPSEA